mmetsp:Transcript_5310/g.14636  ORF Transcript_5310/g.14636 Transcript_5310/m.14636 type:complete len:84 (+) Transcript_5310:773-1024(+)
MSATHAHEWIDWGMVDVFLISSLVPVFGRGGGPGGMCVRALVVRTAAVPTRALRLCVPTRALSLVLFLCVCPQSITSLQRGDK